MNMSPPTKTKTTKRWTGPTVADISHDARAELSQYLHVFGYLATPDEGKDETKLASALTELQKTGGIPQTGKYDEASASLISQPRCGIPDRSKMMKNAVMFATMGSKWDHEEITYRFDSWCADLTQEQVRRAITSAMSLWSYVSPLRFREVPAGTGADIRIAFATGDHGDGNPFDNGGSTNADGVFANVLAHAFSPGNGDDNIAGDCHFDEFETWTEDFLLRVALHELGHSIGLGHSDVPNSVMYAWFTNLDQLQPDDIASVQGRYGPRTKGWFKFQLERDGTMSDNSGIAAVSRRERSMEVWWIRADGAVIDGYWNDEPKGWTMFELAGAGSAAPGGGIAALSRASDYMEIFWVGANGSIEGAWWSQGMDAWGRQRLAPEGSAALNTRITAVSRRKDYMEFWWVAPNGSVQGRWWTKNDNWNGYELAPAGSAAPGSGIKAVSRVPESMELWWVRPDGGITDAYWYDGGVWNRFELAPAGSAAIGSGIAAVARIKDSMELWWISPRGAVIDAYWYPATGWRRFELAPDGSAAIGGIEALARIGETMEVWWSGTDGSLQDAFWYPQPGWRRVTLQGPGTLKLGSNIVATHRMDNHMEMWFSSPGGGVRDFYWYW